VGFSQADIDALRSAMAKGALRVRFGDREVQYRSLDEMRELLREMEIEVGAASGVKRIRRVRLTTSKGLT